MQNRNMNISLLIAQALGILLQYKNGPTHSISVIHHTLKIPVFSQADIYRLLSWDGDIVGCRCSAYCERYERRHIWRTGCQGSENPMRHWLLGSHQQERACQVSLKGKAHSGSSCQAACHRPGIVKTLTSWIHEGSVVCRLNSQQWSQEWGSSISTVSGSVSMFSFKWCPIWVKEEKNLMELHGDMWLSFSHRCLSAPWSPGW